MERNIKAIIEYDGTGYHGFQLQPDVITIQGEIERVLSILFQNKIKIFGAGRTDAGVHALGQVISFKHSSDKSCEVILKAMNGLLPEDIAVSSVEEVDENFHARYSALKRIYQYIILNRSYPDVFRRNKVFFYPHKLNVQSMIEACNYFIGSHDFSSFRTVSKNKEDNNIRTVYRFTCHQSEDFIVSEIEANGFLHSMVRILMGTLLMVGRGRIAPENILDILNARERNKAGPTLPARGLCLVRVIY